jgi:hypothetical protein
MRWDSVNDAGGKRMNEDHVAVFERGAMADILVLDGATALVDDGVDGCNADVVWFVRRFAAEFERLLDAGTSYDALLGAAAGAVAREWDARSAGRDVPPYAWPVASLAWLRVSAGPDGAASVRLASLGDCKALLRTTDGTVRDLDPFDNVQEASLYTEVAALRGQGVQDPAEVFARMLPGLRERRTAQNLAPRPVVLSARPQGPFAVREVAFDAPAGSLLLAMSDGFWRLVDPYALHTADSLMAACAADGLAPLLRALRAFEAGQGGDASLAVKRADDASAVAWRVGIADAR